MLAIGRRRIAIRDQAVLRIRRVPEKAERARLEVDEDGVDHRACSCRESVQTHDPEEDRAGTARREEEKQHRAEDEQRNGKAGTGAKHQMPTSKLYAETIPQPVAHGAAEWLTPLEPLCEHATQGTARDETRDAVRLDK